MTEQQIKDLLIRLEATKDVNGRYTHEAMSCVADLRQCAEELLELKEKGEEL